MDLKIWGLLIVALFIGGFASFTGYFSKIDSAQHELAQAQAELKELEEELSPNESEGGGLTEKESLNELIAAYQTLETEKKALVDSVIALEGQKESYLKAFRETVGDVRSKSVGMQWTDVPFRNGQILKQVRVQKVTDTEITLAHSEGVAKLGADELPADLKERFRIGMEPFLSSSETTVTSATSLTTPTSPGKTPAASKSTKSSKTPSAEVAALDASVASLEREYAESGAKLRAAEESWTQWRARAINLRDQAAGAKTAGRPTYTLIQEANSAEQKATALGAQVGSMRDQNTLLRKKLTNAKIEASNAKR